MNDWQYRGDVDLTNGGYFWNDDNPGADYCEIVEVIPASVMGGPDNLYLIAKGSVYMPEGRKAMVAETCGWEVETRGDWIDAFMGYFGIDADSREWFAIGAVDDTYHPGFDLPDEITYLGRKTDLRGFVNERFL